MANDPDVTLSPMGRVAKFRTMILRADVSMGYADPTSNFRHPKVEIYACNPADPYDYIGRDNRRIEITFQCNRWNEDEGRYHRRAIGGFLRMEGRWTTSYAMRIDSAPIESSSGIAFVRRALDLIEKATTVQIPHTPGKESRVAQCDLLSLIYRLQRSGVEIRVWSKAFSDARWSHRNARERERSAA